MLKPGAIYNVTEFRRCAVSLLTMLGPQCSHLVLLPCSGTDKDKAERQPNTLVLRRKPKLVETFRRVTQRRAASMLR